MALFVNIGGVWKAAQAFVRKNGSWHAATPSVRKAGSWKSLVAPLSAVASSTSLFKSLIASGAQTQTTDPTTVTPSGGTGPYTYAWARISGDAHISADAATSATTTFTATTHPSNDFTAMFQCTVTDSQGATATALVSVEILQDT